ncbi:hypothetical protein IHE45_15G032900 [Dioscorea alata]|uniref:Uncharacterized protein n=3 Tax=Dioscorea alata TaxID=55571 RepID=A0ACB7UKN6_DIOAL|nr:hypothetical protein IHE45_15G032900 [Dioscorea alata]KAH7660992.1 hypothetical protein IHE45_15G032900 [Dioscorea alata]KAH7660993.1 hypothetical protein IHE45_15G032900 [Dioscorea alata]
MLRQTPSRNQRARGFRVKHALQIFLLTAICIWLLYQIKHSHDKKREMEESNLKTSNKIAGNEDGRFNFGRKDLPHAEQIESVNDTQVEEEKEETEEEDEQEPKLEEALDEDERGIGDDAIDEKDHYRGDEEVEEEAKDVKDEEADESDNVRDFQEAREENYRKDDVAGSVHRETQTTDSDTGDDESIDKAGMKEEERLNLADETKNVMENNNTANSGEVDKSKVSVSGVDIAHNASMSNDNNAGVGMTENGNTTAENQSPNVTVVEKKESEDINHSTSMTAGSANNETEIKNNLTTSTESSNPTEPQISDHQAVTQNKSEQGNAVIDDASPQNTTVTLALNTTDKIEPNTTDKIEPNTTDKTEPMTNDNANVGNVTTKQTEKADGTSTSITNDNGDGSTEGVVANNSTDHVITEEEKDARIDLSTLAESVDQNLRNGDDDAAE